MAQHLRPRDVQAIIDSIRGWPETKLTWEAVCREAAKLLGRKPARQTLFAHEKIKTAYEAKKEGLQVRGPRSATPSSLSVAAQRLARQQSIIDELKTTNAGLLEKFVRWQYNAFKHGLTEQQLNADLPRIDRGRTVLLRMG